MVLFRVHMTVLLELHLKVHFKNYTKMHKQVTPENALKGLFQVALELHLFMAQSMHNGIQNDSIKGEIEEALYAALEDASKISFQEAFKTL